VVTGANVEGPVGQRVRTTPIRGVVTFRQKQGNFPEPGVKVEAAIRGLRPTSPSDRVGFHIHENANCATPADPNDTQFSAAGGHYDPGPNSNSNPDANHPYHMGDIPNLKVDDGTGRLRHETSRITLSDGPLTVFDPGSGSGANPNNGSQPPVMSGTPGSAVIVHLNEDQGATGPPGSGVSGGPRLACGVIERTEEDDD
jgi:Cu-Zn family superoxide dismutase